MKKKYRIVSKVIKDGKTGFNGLIRDTIALFEDKRVIITIEQYKRKRSLKQERYYRGVVFPAIRQIIWAWQGMSVTDEQVHRFIKEIIWEWYEDVPVMGATQRILLPSPDIEMPIYEEFMTKTRAWAAERGIQIQEPNEKIPEWIEEAYEGKI